MSYLRDLGYSAVAFPKTSLIPGTVLVKQNNRLVLPSPLEQIFEAGDHEAPVVSQDEPASNVNGKRTRKLRLNIGLDILGSIIGAMGGNLGLTAQYSKAKNIEFVYNDVKVNFLGTFDAAREKVVPNFAALDTFLSDADLRAGPAILAEIKQGDLFIVVETIKSAKFTDVATRSNSQELALNVPVLQGIAGGSLKVGSENDKNTQISYEGAVPLVFGCKVIQVRFNGGSYEVAKQSIQSVESVAGRESAPGGSGLDLEVFTTGGVVVPIGD